jgi:hypothetical protein
MTISQVRLGVNEPIRCHCESCELYELSDPQKQLSALREAVRELHRKLRERRLERLREHGISPGLLWSSARVVELMEAHGIKE